jgi:tRNA uracil 4-sulfurtransferase
VPDPPPEATFLLRYGEIGIKSLPVRRRFERLLADNLLRGLKARGVQGKVTPVWGRLVLHAPLAEGREVVRRTLGVVSSSEVRAAPLALDALAEAAAREADAIPDHASFAVRPRRSGEVGYTSQDMGKALGAAILARHKARGLRVDLGSPEVEVVAEVREGQAWLALDVTPGPGGLPVGSEGRVVAWLASPRDACAAWMAMKRGCRVDLLAPPGQGEDLARRLAAWDGGIELTEVPTGADRALTLQLLAAHARRRKASAVVVGDGFAEAVALAPLDRTIMPPVFRPLLALDAAMLDRIAGDLGLKVEAAPPAPPMARPGDPAAAEARALDLLHGTRRRRVLP